MKKRLIKKWVKRYINPLIENMPTTDRGTVEISDGYMVRVYGNNHSIKNGYDISEGTMIPQSSGIRRDIIRTAETIQLIIDTNKIVFLRIMEFRGKRLYVRLITE